jgi:drug/metabolite transporter (DMT)-like permease
MWFTTALLAPALLRDTLREGRLGRHQGYAERKDDSGRPHTRGRTVVLLSVLSGLFLSLHFAAWITSLSHTSVASSTVLVTTHPIIVAVAGFFILRERLSVRAIMFMIAALAGGAVLVIGGFGAGGSEPLGNLLAFLGAVAISGYMLIGRVVRQHLSATRYTFIAYGASAVLLASYAAIAGNPFFGYEARELLIFLALAVVCTLLGHSLFNWALRFVSPTVVSTSILGETVVASMLAIAIFGEIPTIHTIAGGGVILVSIFLFIRESNRQAGRRRFRDANPR